MIQKTLEKSPLPPDSLNRETFFTPDDGSAHAVAGAEQRPKVWIQKTDG